MKNLIKVSEKNEFKCYNRDGDTVFVLDQIQAISYICIKGKIASFTVYLNGNKVELEFDNENMARENRDQILRELARRFDIG